MNQLQNIGVFTSSYRYGYQGSESDPEVYGSEKTSYTTHFRMLDVRIGRWLSTDPVTQAHQSPYTSMDNNPIWFNDVKGDSINDKAIYKSGDKELISAYETFAQSKEGIEFMAQYASAGQTIGGHTYKSDGDMVKEKIYLTFIGMKTINGAGGMDAWGMTGMDPKTKDVNGFTSLSVFIAFDFGNSNYNESKSGGFYNSKVSNGEITKAKNYKELAILKTIAHEVLIHGIAFTKDYLDNGFIDNSPFPNADGENTHHNWANKSASKSAYGRSYYDLIKAKNKLAPNLSNDEIWNWMFGTFPKSIEEKK